MSRIIKVYCCQNENNKNYYSLISDIFKGVRSDSTFPNHAGQCGRFGFDDFRFWLIKENSKKLIFSFSSNSGSVYTTYSYNNGKSHRSGRFYVENNSSEAEGDTIVDKTYWKDSSTYVVQVSEENLVRNFYISFVTINKKTTATLVAGKLEHEKVVE